MRSFQPLLWAILLFILSTPASSQDLRSWKTDWEKRSVDIDEIQSGGVPRDGIPPIDNPKFVSLENAKSWIASGEPVVVVQLARITKLYPLQILTFHEIVNDRFGEELVSVTFCPLCYSAIVFDRNLDGKIYDFGVSGLLRNSDLIMYDRQTESLWQQFTGEAIVGELTGKKLRWHPAQLLSFGEASASFPEALVLSKDTGFNRNYGQNPYVAYDAPGGKPYFAVSGKTSLPPMEKVIGVKIDSDETAYAYATTRQLGVVHDEVGGSPVVIFHTKKGARSALDKQEIAKSRDEGSVGVFNPVVDGNLLSFSRKGNRFADSQTGSIWDITGKAVSGDYQGEQLTPVVHGTYFAFAWFAFQPESTLYQP